VRAEDHIGFKTKELSMDLQEYCRKHFQYEELIQILLQACNSLVELHNLGYVHNSLAPKKIMVSLNPLDVKIVGFNKAKTQLDGTKRAPDD
jgi:serine/threonine protein kinase